MLPLLPFAAGLVAGAAALKLWRSQGLRSERAGQTLAAARRKMQDGADSARSTLREAAVSGLTRLENASAAWREKLDDKGRVVDVTVDRESAKKPARSRPAAAKTPKAKAPTAKAPRAGKAAAPAKRTRSRARTSASATPEAAPPPADGEAN